MNYEINNNYSFPIPSGGWMGASAEEELEVHVTSDDGIDVIVFVSVTSEVTYYSDGDYETPPAVETEESNDVWHESEGRELSAKEIETIYERCIELAYV